MWTKHNMPPDTSITGLTGYCSSQLLTSVVITEGVDRLQTSLTTLISKPELASLRFVHFMLEIQNNYTVFIFH